MTSLHPEIGVLLPHFGSAARVEQLRDITTAATAAGLGALWARDHLVYGPHGMEDPDPTFLETFTTLGHVTAHAPDLDVGTAAVIPIRHPLMLAKAAATIAGLTTGRLRLGIGAGFRDSEFAAVGLHSDLATRAREIVPATFDILRQLQSGPRVEYEGPHWSFAVDQQPMLPSSSSLLYCGTSPLALRISTQHADGWAPGRINAPTLRRRLREAGRDGLEVVVAPLVSVASSRRRAAQSLDLPALLEYANGHRWLDPPSSGVFESADDLEGIVLHGTPAQIGEGVERLRAAGATHVVLDLRLNWNNAPEDIEELAAHIPRSH